MGITYDINAVIHMTLGCFGFYSPAFQLIYFKCTKKCSNSFVLICLLLGYLYVSICYTSLLFCSEYWKENSRANRKKAIKYEWMLLGLAAIAQYWIIYFAEKHENRIIRKYKRSQKISKFSKKNE